MVAKRFNFETLKPKTSAKPNNFSWNEILNETSIENVI